MNPQDPNNLPNTYVDPYALANSQPVYSPQAEVQPYVEQPYVQEPYQQPMQPSYTPQHQQPLQPVQAQPQQTWQDQSYGTYAATPVAIAGGGSKKATLAIIIAVTALIISTSLSALALIQSSKKNGTGSTGNTTQSKSDTGSTDINASTSQDETAKNKFPESSRQAFLSACISSGGTDAACECVLSGIEERLTFEQFKEADSQITASGQAPDYFNDAQSEALQECS